MLETILNIISPHHCFGCGEIGAVLCVNCKYDITSEPYQACIACGLLSDKGVCGRHRLPYSRAWVVTSRHGGVERLLNGMKYHSVRAAAIVAGDLLEACLPELPQGTLIVPVPTISKHIRLRGFDHTLYIAKRVARLKKLKVARPLQRATDTHQVGSSRQERLTNAKQAFLVANGVDINGATCLLVDDIYTSGATLRYAAEALRQAGAAEVWLGVVARQELE